MATVDKIGTISKKKFVKNKRAFYYFRSQGFRIPAMLAIQAENIEPSVSVAKKQQQGFLSFMLSGRPLHCAMKLGLVRGVLRRKNHRFTGFAAALPVSIAMHVPWLDETIKQVRSRFPYPCFLQLCVEQQNRRKGVGRNLLSQIKFEARKHQFDAVVSVIHKDNLPGVLFLLQEGFSILKAPFDDRVIFYLGDDL